MMALLRLSPTGVSRLEENDLREPRFMHAPELIRMGAEIDVQGRDGHGSPGSRPA